MIHHHFLPNAHNGPLHLTDITLHGGYQDNVSYPVMTLFFQNNQAMTAEFEDALNDLDGFIELLQHNPDHNYCHVGGPMLTPVPYLPHIHFTSAIFGSPMRYMIFNKLVTFGHLRQDEVIAMMGTFFGMVEILPQKKYSGNMK